LYYTHRGRNDRPRLATPVTPMLSTLTSVHEPLL